MYVITHRDADGIDAAYLFGEAHQDIDSEPLEGIDYAKSFGYVDKQLRAKDYLVMLDMRPQSPVNLNIDHHPPKERPNVKDLLIWGDIPTSGLVYQRYKDKIPKEQHWKVLVGLMGDGQPVTTPLEIWENNPFLLEDVSYLSFYYGEPKATILPAYKTLSSPINAVSAIGKPELAMEIISEANKPSDIYLHPETISARKELSAERKKIFETGKSKALDLGGILYFPYKSEKVRGMAGMLERAFSKTTVALNLENNAISIRGDLMPYLARELTARGYYVGGHKGFGGGELKPEQVSDFENVVRSIVRGLRFGKKE